MLFILIIYNIYNIYNNGTNSLAVTTRTAKLGLNLNIIRISN